MTSKVYVVQKQMRWDEVTGSLVPKFDLSGAEQFGELIYLLSPSAAPFNSRPIVAELSQKLAEYRPEDYLLLVGNPCLIGMVSAIAAQVTGGFVRFLQWSGKNRAYVEIDVNLLY